MEITNDKMNVVDALHSTMPGQAGNVTVDDALHGGKG